MVPSRTRVSQKAPPLIEGNPVRNELLLGLPSLECDAIFSELTFVQLRTHDVLQETEELIKYAYFVDSGMVSILSVMQDGKSVEVGLTGKEGCTALQLVAGFKKCLEQNVNRLIHTVGENNLRGSYVKMRGDHRLDRLALWIAC